MESGLDGMVLPSFIRIGARWTAGCGILAGSLALAPAGALAQSTAAIEGVVTTDAGAVPLPGVDVSVTREPAGTTAAAAVTDAAGRYVVEGLAPGRYRVHARFGAFDEVVGPDVLTPAAGQTLRFDIDMPLQFSASAEAVSRPVEIPQTGAAQQTIAGSMIDVAPVRGDDYSDLLPILPGVVRGPDGRINMKGGRPSQTGLQVGDAYASDPTTGDVGVGLPADAVATIDVLPNPYAAEFGRFSAGVTRIETRRGDDAWRFTANNFIPVPCLKICNGENLGIRSYDPRLVVSGPLVPGRLYLAQSLQYRDHRTRVTSLPPEEADTELRSLDAFTRLDATVGRHTLKGTVAVFPQNRGFVGLDTFNRRPVTPDLTRRGFAVTLTDTLRLSNTTVLDTTVSTTRLDIGIDGRGDGPMVVTPDERLGRFFNTQARRSRSYQLKSALSFVRLGLGEHFVKVGVDALSTSFDGTSTSAPVEVRRADGTLSQRIEFTGPATQQVSATDVGLFVQDKWRPSDRLLLEVGARFDQDGVSGFRSLSPRLGFVVSVLEDGQGVLRGGVGLFAERTPLLAGAFESIESPRVTRYAADGVTEAGATVAFPHQVDGAIRPTTARVWNVEYDQKLPGRWLLKLSHLDRHGEHGLIVNPVESGGTGAITLASLGRTDYRETEITARYRDEAGRELTASYVHSRSTADLNPFDAYFGNLRNPILRTNEYGRTGVDVPHRLVALAVVPFREWLVAPLVEVRSGFPYSVVDEDQQFVGPRNAGGRFPTFSTLDLRISRQIQVLGRDLRVGFRSTHLLHNFLPRDVRNNIDSATFGSLHNPISRRIGLTIEITP